MGNLAQPKDRDIFLKAVSPLKKENDQTLFNKKFP